MSQNAGSVYVVLSGESASLERAMTAAEQKLLAMEQRCAKAGAAVAAVSNRVDELRDKQALLTKALADGANEAQRDEAKMEALRQELDATTASLTRMTTAQSKGGGGLKAFEERMGKASGALAAMSSALGSGESQTAKWGQAMVGIAGAFAAGGPVGAGIAAGAAAIEYLTSKMAASEKAAAELEAQFNGIVDAARAVRDATAAKTVGMDRDIVTANVVSTAGGDREAQIFEARQRLAFELEDSGRRVQKIQSALLAQQSSMVGLEGEKLVKAQALEQAMQAELSIGQQNTAELGKQFAKIPDLVDAHMKIAKAAEARARAEEAAARALDRQFLHLVKGTPPVNMRGVMSATSAAGVAGAVGSAGGNTEFIEAQLMNEPEGDPNRFTPAPPPAVSSVAPFISQARIAGLSLDALADAANNNTGAFADLEQQIKEDKKAAQKQWDATAEGAAGAAASGNLSGAGSMIGSAAGTVVGNVIAPGIGGAIGGGLGSALGGMLGGLLETLMESLGVLTPVFDALALIVGALAPVFEVVGVLLDAVSGVIVALVPTIAALAEPVAALLLVAVRLVQAFLPFLSILLLSVGGLIAFLEVITAGVQWLDTNFFRPLSSGVAWVYNGFVDFYNGIINFIRGLEIAGQRPFEDFGVLMDHMETKVDDTIGGFATGIDGIRDKLNPPEPPPPEPEPKGGSNSSSTNVPSWFRAPLAEYRAAGGTGGQGGSGGGSASNAGGIAINGPVTFVMPNADIAAAVRKGLVKMRGVAVGGPRRSNDDDSN